MLSRSQVEKLTSKEKDDLIMFLQEKIQQFEFRIQELEARLSKDSQNSNKPPSTDWSNKPAPKSQRQKSGQKPGGQPGHRGSTLGQVADPDDVLNHAVSNYCQECGDSLEGVVKSVEIRQEFDLPPVQPLHVTEHRIEGCKCKGCGYMNKGAAPDHITQPVQYGPRMNAIGVYLGQNQLMPGKRVCETFWDLLGVKISEGWLYKAYERFHNNLAGYDQAVKGMIQSAPVAHFDESGLRVAKALFWLHVASTAHLTYYAVHQKRGSEAMEAIGILPAFKGRAIHDHWKAYFSYLCLHGLGNEHHLRELTYHHEQYAQTWCVAMQALLLHLKGAVDAAQGLDESSFSEVRLACFDAEYDRILTAGLLEIPTIAKSTGKRGREKQHPSRNLLNRLVGFKEETLAFTRDFNVPFTNNQGEQDIRMVKVKQKVSGCFRSLVGAQIFCRTRGYISTMRKQGHRVFDALVCAVGGRPIIPNTS